MWRRGGYIKGFFDRFGFIRVPERNSVKVKRIWLQAVSVGELLAIRPILESFATDPTIEVVLTTTTSTGMKIALQKYSGMAITIGIFPLDFWLFSRSAWSHIQPDTVILTESELWPEHLHQARRRRVPVILINARLSDRSYKIYKTVPFLSRILFRQIDKLLASSQHDYDRFLDIGVESPKIRAFGNIKCDIHVEPLLSKDKIRNLMREFGFQTENEETRTPFIILGASTWPGEEEALLATLKTALKNGINCRLVIVPRHPERRKEIQTVLEGNKLSFHFRSDTRIAQSNTMIYVGDTIGELRSFIQASDIVFVGRSLPPHREGQTPIEAAAYGKPILTGKGMRSFHDISQSLIACGGALEVESALNLKEEILRLLQSETERREMAEAALQWHSCNQGATMKTIDEVMNLMHCIDVNR
ncbi:MAG: 3-deoxy-D-manno-octulosonic acid transferase [Candidatus Moanabacter tarae]|uniref:3-deoxy-D-manno-octulosonic acid transferase n=1 Tax=Candidatus Moanibacter tarae TaxID=2200854 RepID=A0A2Z4AJ82_9BACT|nr:MAG: 3-deoxy-D-manno-octulosonic acid transferase [Candidatus Moanabacter tarae]|tara:strand:+ start:10732 stop:11985 length:1254 start_codon:yes stop_codon:yes gene_type:complete